jgi:uncharacterized protein YicC (UPF0701 family)
MPPSRLESQSRTPFAKLSERQRARDVAARRMQRRCRMSDEKPVPETLETIAARIAALGKSTDERFAQVDERFAQVDERFDEVSEAFVEQRKYTEFAFGKLRSDMNGGFNRLDRKLDRVLTTLTRTLSSRRRRRS